MAHQNKGTKECGKSGGAARGFFFKKMKFTIENNTGVIKMYVGLVGGVDTDRRCVPVGERV